MIAIKFQSQNTNNVEDVPAYWPWKKTTITDEESADFEAAGWSVFTEVEYDEYLKEKKVPLETHYIAKMTGQYKYLDVSIQSKIDFAQSLIAEFKKKNISEGINALQGLWMHQRTRALPVTLNGITFTVDLMNMVISGDLELACLSLMNTPADNMTMPFHWLSQERLNFLVAKLKIYLGWS